MNPKNKERLVVRKVPVVREEEVIEEEPEGLTQDDIATRELQEKISEFRAQHHGQDYKIYVDKFIESEKKWAAVDRYPLENFDPFDVRDVFGGGRYRTKLYDGSNRYVKSGGYMEFYFVEPPKKKEAEPVVQTNPMESPILQILMKQNEAQQQQMLTLLQAMVQSPKNSGSPPLTEMVEVMLKMKALEGGRDSSFKNITEAMNLMKVVRESFPEKSEDSGSLISDIRQALTLLPALKNLGGNNNPNPVPALPNGSSGAAVSLPGVAGVPPVDGAVRPSLASFGIWTPVMEVIAPHAVRFEEAAKRQEQVNVWADYLLDVIEKEVLPVLTPIIRQDRKVPKIVTDEALQDMIVDGLAEEAEKPETLDKICALWPAFQNSRGWVFQVLHQAVQNLNQPENLENSPPQT